MKELPTLNSTKSLDEAAQFYRENCSGVETITVPVQDIQVDDDGIVHCNGHKLELSEPGLKTLSRIVNIPARFASRIPTHLLSENVNELKVGKDAVIDMYYLDNTLLSAIKSPSVGLDSEDILEGARELLNGFEIREIYLTPVELRVKTTSPTLTIGDAKVGDITEIGYMFNTSPVAYLRPSGQLYLYELRCTNGAVVGVKFGGFKMRVRSIDPEQFVQSFFAQVSNLNRLQGRLSNALRKSYEVVPSYKDAYATYSKIKRVTGEKELAMECIKIDNEEDLSALKTLSMGEDTSLQDYEEVTYREIIYNVTHLANSFQGDTKLRLQKSAGKMLIGLS